LAERSVAIAQIDGYLIGCSCVFDREQDSKIELAIAVKIAGNDRRR
jgi:hypothetical protein